MADEQPRNAQQQGQQNEAQGKGKSPIYINNIIERTSKSNFWIIVLILLVILGLAWYFDFLRISLIWIFAGTFVIFIFYGLISGISQKDSTKIFISLALLVWLIDMIPSNFPYIGPLLGPPYAGFELNIKELIGTINTSWGAIITSGVVFVFLYVNIIFSIIKKEIASFLLSFFFIIISNNLVAKYFPTSLIFNFSVPLGIIVFLVFIAGGFWIASKLNKKFLTEIPNFFTYLFMAFVFSFFWINSGWVTNTRAEIHAFYIICFGFLYIMRKERENPRAWHLLIPTLLIADFYGYGLLWSTEYIWLKFIPIFVLFVISYCYYKTESTFALVTFIVLITIILILSLQVTAYEEAGTLQFRQKAGIDFTQFFNEIAERSKEFVVGRLDIATGGLYSGNVEKNRYESLGVYFANLRAADPRFYTDEQITLWGSIRSKTYQDAVIIKFNCSRWKQDNTKRISADVVIPEKKFPIFTLEDVDTECRFLPKKEKDKAIQPGTNTVTFSAEYNFGTDAYLKTYFIDRDRFRAYTKEGIEPLTQFGIKDKSPAAVFTNGPVEIGMSAGPLVLVSEGYTIKPTIGITLTNRQEIQDKDKKLITKWEGKIKNITELVLLVPPGIKLHNDDDSESLKTYCNSKYPEEKIKCPCSMPFVKYNLEDCQSSCTNYVSKPCNDACLSAFGGENANCIYECNANVEKCLSECNFLFAAEGNLKGTYKGYALDVGSIEFKDLNKDIDKHRSFQCRFDFDTALPVLDETPITTRYFRVRARYNYLIENSVTINVETPPIGAQESIAQDLFKLIFEYTQYRPDIQASGITPELILAIASVETGRRHCCKDASKTNAANCEPTGESTCPGRVIASYDGSSVGIMQINKINEKLAETYCKSGQTIYDKECNINVGIEILNLNYKKYKDGIKRETLEKYCPSKDQPLRHNKYLSYRGYYAAIRAYNGWGCSSKIDDKCRLVCSSSRNPETCVQNCISGTVDYVEKVDKAFRSIKGTEIIDTTTLRSVAPGESTPTPVRDEEEILQQSDITQSTQIAPTKSPSYVSAGYNSAIRTATISWDKATSPDVSRYEVYFQGVRVNTCDMKSDGRETYTCTHQLDNSISGGTYTYSVLTYTTDGKYLQKDSNQVSIPFT